MLAGIRIKREVERNGVITTIAAAGVKQPPTRAMATGVRYVDAGVGRGSADFVEIEYPGTEGGAGAQVVTPGTVVGCVQPERSVGRWTHIL